MAYATLGYWGWRAASPLSQFSKHPTFVLGNPHSGATLIADQLARHGGLPITSDLRHLTPAMVQRLQEGTLAFEQMLDRHRLDFSHGVINASSLPLFYTALAETFPQAEIVMVVRDPRDNIRSILNHFGVPGHLDQRDAGYPQPATTPTGSWTSPRAYHYVEPLADQWNRHADLYFQHRDAFHLINFETFMKYPEDTITQLAVRCGIRRKVFGKPVFDKPNLDLYTSEIPWQKTFGTTNLRRIETVCGSRMAELGYLPLPRATLKTLSSRTLL